MIELSGIVAIDLGITGIGAIDHNDIITLPGRIDEKPAIDRFNPDTLVAAQELIQVGDKTPARGDDRRVKLDIGDGPG